MRPNRPVEIRHGGFEPRQAEEGGEPGDAQEDDRRRERRADRAPQDGAADPVCEAGRQRREHDGPVSENHADEDDGGEETDDLQTALPFAASGYERKRPEGEAQIGKYAAEYVGVEPRRHEVEREQRRERHEEYHCRPDGVRPFRRASISEQEEYCGDRESGEIAQSHDPRRKGQREGAGRDQRRETERGRPRSCGNGPAEERKAHGGDGRREQAIGRNTGQVDAEPVREQQRRKTNEGRRKRQGPREPPRQRRDGAGSGERARRGRGHRNTPFRRRESRVRPTARR